MVILCRMGAKQVMIRSLMPSDYGTVVEIWQEAGLSYRGNGRDAQAPFCRELKGETAIFLGAVVHDDLVGVLLGTHDGRKGWVNRLAVRPQHRRQGIGRSLVQELERRLARRGIQMVACLIEGENGPSRAFFQSLGYVDHPQISYHAKRRSQDW